MKRGSILFLMLLSLPVRVLGSFSIGGEPAVQKAPAATNYSTLVAVIGIVVAVFLIYWFVFKKKKK